MPSVLSFNTLPMENKLPQQDYGFQNSNFENSDFGDKNYIEKYEKAKESLDAYFDIMKEYFWELWD